MDIQQLLAINIMLISALALAGAAVQGAWRGNMLWMGVNALVVAVGAGLLQWAPRWSGALVTVLFLPLVAAPLMLARMTQSRIYQRRMREAATLARLASWVHPTRQMRLNAALIEAQSQPSLAQQQTALARLAERAGPREKALITVTMLRLEGRWEELLVHLERHPGLGREMGSARVRALGELGLVDQMTRAYDDAKSGLHGLDLLEAQLFVLAFAGRPDEVARMVEGALAGLDSETKTYWVAIATKCAGADPGLWQPGLERLAAGAAEPSVRRAAARVLASADARAVRARLDELSAVIVEDCAAGIGRMPTAEEHRAGATPVTWLLLAAVALTYLLSEMRGGSENMRTLVDLGALWPPYVLKRGEWWRLVTALMLHWGPLHAGINALMLVMLGRVVERAFGSIRMLLIYWLGGLASTGFVLWLAASGLSEPAVLVGASGAIMALFGGLVGRTIVTWLQHRDVLDGRNLVMMLFIVLLQVAADLAMPQVSLAAHASGFVAGLILGSLLTFAGRNRRATG